MPIPEDQLATWSKQGAITTAKSTHERVEATLRRHGPAVEYEVFLQGSYRNSTNIYGDSDVDVVAALTSTFYPDLSTLPSLQQAAFHRRYPSASYTWDQFRRDALGALRTGFGYGAVSDEEKCLRVAAGSGRLQCDVVPALEYRLYTSFPGFGDGTWIPGIVFWSRSTRRQIVNFPKPHYDNGVAKQQSTSQWYKSVVRLFKNARNAAVQRGYLRADVAPSYFLECFVHCVPSTAFGRSYAQSFCEVVNWWSRADLSRCLCQNGVTPLFGSTSEQWSETAAKQLIYGLSTLWNGWR